MPSLCVLCVGLCVLCVDWLVGVLVCLLADMCVGLCLLVCVGVCRLSGLFGLVC